MDNRDDVMDNIQRDYPKELKNLCNKKDTSSKSWVRCIDDTVMWSETLEAGFKQKFIFIQECNQEGVVLNLKKNPVWYEGGGSNRIQLDPRWDRAHGDIYQRTYVIPNTMQLKGNAGKTMPTF